MSYVIIHTPSPTDIEQGYGYWVLWGEIPEDFNDEGLEVYNYTSKELINNPFSIDQVRYWQGKPKDIVRLIKSLKYDSNSPHNLGRALFGA